MLTDNGKEFKAGFVSSCAAHQVTHTRIKPRHAWTNGFVERLQGTILHEHWRIAFRRHYFTSARALQRSLDRFPGVLQPGPTPSWLPPPRADASHGLPRGLLPRDRARRPHPTGPARAANAWIELSTPLRNWTH